MLVVLAAAAAMATPLAPIVIITALSGLRGSLTTKTLFSIGQMLVAIQRLFLFIKTHCSLLT
jgi:hypothetical protein